MRPARTAELSRAFRPVLARRRGVAVALWGEPGSGKSHTADMFLRDLPCRTVSLPGAATPADLQAALDVASSGTVGNERDVASLATGHDSDAPSLAQALAKLAPLVLFLDDVPLPVTVARHWVGLLAEAVTSCPGVGLLITARGRPRRPFRPIRLVPLSRAAIYELLQEEMSAPLPDAALAWIHDEAAGNPLFAREYLRHLTHRGFLWSDGRQWRWRAPEAEDVPPTVDALVEQALAVATESPTVKSVAETCAMVPAGVTPSVLAKVSGVSRAEVDAALMALESTGVYLAGDFAHPTFRRRLVGSVDPEVRAQLASRGVLAFRRQPRVAAAFLTDASIEPAEATRILVAAADETFDAATSGRHLAQAASYAAGEERGELALRAAGLLRYQDPVEATRLAQLALDCLPTSSDAALLLAEIRAVQGDSAGAELTIRYLTEPERSRVLLSLLAMAGEHGRVLELWRGSGGDWWDPDTLALVSAALLEVGDHDAAEELAASLLSGAEGTARLRLLTVLGGVRHRQGRFSEAIELLTTSIEDQDQARPSRDLAAALRSRAEVWQSLGRLDRKREDISEAIAIYAALADPRSVATTRVKLGVLLLEEGDHVAAEDELQASHASLELIGAHRELVDCERMLCYLYRQQNLPFGPALARKYANSALSRARGIGNAHLIADALYEAAYAESLAGNPRAGLSLADECIAASSSLGSRQTLVYALFARAHAHENLADIERARADLERAAAEASLLGLEMDSQTIGLELDRLAGDVETALERRAWFEARGQARRAQMVDQYFPDATLGSLAGRRARRSVRLELLGPARLHTAEGVVPIRGRKRQRLLALLLEARVAGRGEASRAALIDELYPTKDERRASSSLKELVHGLRAGLAADLVTTTASGYALGDCPSDVEEFLLNRDITLWRGHYQAGSDLGLAPVSESLYLRLREGAESAIVTRPAEVAKVGRLLVEADPYDRRALRIYLLALRRLSNHRSLARHYQAARSNLAEVGERLPDRWQDFLDGTATIGR